MTTLKKISLLSLTLLITGSIDSIRNLPATALFGSSLIFFVAFAGVLFLLPTALVSAELAANIDEGGIYQWTCLAFGKRIGFLAVWLQWVNNIFWFPTVLSFIAGTAAYLINPILAQNKYYLVCAILVIFWFLTWVNLKGVHLSSKFAGICTIVGLFIPVASIIFLAGVWLVSHQPIQIHVAATSIFPHITEMNHWIALTAIMLSFTGMELTTVHIKEVHEPVRSFPKALAYASIIILLTMMLGSLAIAFVIPYDQINLVNGTIQTFTYFLSVYHFSYLVPLFTVLLVVGSIGGLMSWVSGPIRGLSQAANHRFLPPFFQTLNRHHVPKNLLITQAFLVSIVGGAYLLIPNINSVFWLLMALATQLYMLMYVIMFLAALKLRHRLIPNNRNTFRIPGERVGTSVVCLLGLLGCAITLCVGFIPPPFYTGNYYYYEALFLSSMLAMLLPIILFFSYHASSRKKSTTISKVISH